MNTFIFYITFLSLMFSPSLASDAEAEFHYKSGETADPSKWSSCKPEWKICGEGKRQSPIDLSPNVSRIVHNASQLLRTFYNPAEAILKNRGFDLKVKWEGDAGKIVINGTDYKIVQGHWHAPSEHLIKGKKFAMEFHMVHQNSEGDLAVVGVLFDEGEPNAFISKIEDKIHKIADINQGEISLGQIDPKEFEGDLTNFYEYQGSLTTPPCSEDVIWIVVADIGTVSRQQIEALTDARRGGYEANARPAQPLQGRLVYYNEQSTPSKEVKSSSHTDNRKFEM